MTSRYVLIRTMPTNEKYVIFQTFANNKVQTHCQCLNHSQNNMRKALPPSGPFSYPTVYSNHTLFYNTHRVTVVLTFINEYYLQWVITYFISPKIEYKLLTFHNVFTSKCLKLYALRLSHN